MTAVRLEFQMGISNAIKVVEKALHVSKIARQKAHVFRKSMRDV
jgi:hypothetical protein